MRNRTIGINVRVNENEKKKLQKNAKKSNLNLSSYLRKAGLQKEIYAIPDEELRKIYAGIVELKNEFSYMSNEEMKTVQNRFDKTTGNVAYHAYQSFKTGEVTAELAHQIGVKLAEKMWNEYQVVVATHLDTGTYHNHFVVNSVNMFTGKKFNCNKGAYYHFRDLSDGLCREYGLTIIEKPRGKTPRSIYFAEKRGEPTKYNVIRQAIDETMEMCINYGQF